VEGALTNTASLSRTSSPLALILLSMSSIPPRTNYVCKRCIQRLSYHNAAKSEPKPKPYCVDPSKQHSTRRNNGVTWEGMRFRKVKLDESGLSKWHASKILVGRNPRPVPAEGPPSLRMKPIYTDVPTLERPFTDEPTLVKPRSAGRIRGGRARIPGPVATEYLKSKMSAEDIVPSAPSARILGPVAAEHDKSKISNKDLVPSEPSALLGGLDDDFTPKARPVLSKSVSAEYKPGEHFNWYWETLPPEMNELSIANNFFLKGRNPVKLVRSAARFRDVPDSDVPEVAFVGRSNVGKSSLLNAIVNANMKDLLARTSATRGFTRTMNFYGIGPGTGITLQKDATGREKITGTGVVLVDMPGYGGGSLSSWGVEIMKYFQSRKQLRRIFVLLDAEHGIKEKDRSLLASLRLAGVSHQVILSKMDKLYIPKSEMIYQISKTGRNKLKSKGTVEALRKMMGSLKPDINPPVGGGALGEILACSSEVLLGSSRLGVDHVRYAVLKAVGLEGRQKKITKSK
jgi:GTP-binding protein